MQNPEITKNAITAAAPLKELCNREAGRPEKWIGLRLGENGIRKMTQKYPKRENETNA